VNDWELSGDGSTVVLWIETVSSTNGLLEHDTEYVGFYELETGTFDKFEIPHSQADYEGGAGRLLGVDRTGSRAALATRYVDDTDALVHETFDVNRTSGQARRLDGVRCDIGDGNMADDGTHISCQQGNSLVDGYRISGAIVNLDTGVVNEVATPAEGFGIPTDEFPRPIVLYDGPFISGDGSSFVILQHRSPDDGPAQNDGNDPRQIRWASIADISG
jgi:hypothetical protein